MIPLGLKETKELDWSTALKVRLAGEPPCAPGWGCPALGCGETLEASWGSCVIERMRKLRPRARSVTGGVPAFLAVGNSAWAGFGEESTLGWVWQSWPPGP